MARKAKQTFDTEKDPFPTALREMMTEKNITQTELAENIGVTRQAISLYATGQSTPDIKTFEKIVRYFEVSADYMLGISNVKSTDLIDKEINKELGLSGKSIEILRNANESETFKLLNWEKIAMCNILIENMNSTRLLENLYRYIFGNFGFPISEEKGMAYLATKIVISTPIGNNTTMLNASDISNVYWSKLHEDIIRFKDKESEKYNKE